ncbi:hypothetical protein HZH66_009476 [Vespula vulgaris]|uniref:Uncharacterized protein n=1 Tax=Vespula vulgaris TaxID=7454 RepID=A0A834JM23_VESVU|nr:hypothetical protein HZH66_009476 [Vespula vulgaris]
MEGGGGRGGMEEWREGGRTSKLASKQASKQAGKARQASKQRGGWVGGQAGERSVGKIGIEEARAEEATMKGYEGVLNETHSTSRDVDRLCKGTSIRDSTSKLKKERGKRDRDRDRDKDRDGDI